MFMNINYEMAIMKKTTNPNVNIEGWTSFFLITHTSYSLSKPSRDWYDIKIKWINECFAADDYEYWHDNTFSPFGPREKTYHIAFKHETDAMAFKLKWL
jgi:hypothetical protein